MQKKDYVGGGGGGYSCFSTLPSIPAVVSWIRRVHHHSVPLHLPFSVLNDENLLFLCLHVLDLHLLFIVSECYLIPAGQFESKVGGNQQIEVGMLFAKIRAAMPLVTTGGCLHFFFFLFSRKITFDFLRLCVFAAKTVYYTCFHFNYLYKVSFFHSSEVN